MYRGVVKRSSFAPLSYCAKDGRTLRAWRVNYLVKITEGPEVTQDVGFPLPMFKRRPRGKAGKRLRPFGTDWIPTREIAFQVFGHGETALAPCPSGSLVDIKNLRIEYMETFPRAVIAESVSPIPYEPQAPVHQRPYDGVLEVLG